jgi:sugar phosphate isomerase/epimerase
MVSPLPVLLVVPSAFAGSSAFPGCRRKTGSADGRCVPRFAYYGGPAMDKKLNRRDFIRNSSVLSLSAATGAGLGGGVGSAQTPISRVGGSKLKLSLNAFSFSRALNREGMTLIDLLEFCAEHDFDALDPTGYFFPGYPEVPSDEYINEFKLRALHLGLDISGTGVRNNFAEPDKEQRAADVKHVKEWLEVAAKMGAPVLRVFAGNPPEGHTWDQVAEWMAEDLRECVECGKQYGVVVGIQNHGGMLKSADEVLKILTMVDSEWIGVIVDTGFFLTDDPYEDIRRVIPHAVNWQIKEKLFGKESDVYLDLKKLVGIIRDGGYRGYIPIETLSIAGTDYDPRVEVPKLLKQVREALA